MNYSAETIFFAVQRCLNGERSLTVARQLNISQASINTWRKKYQGLSLNEIENLLNVVKLKNVIHLNRSLNIKSGQKFGKLTAIEPLKELKGNCWKFQCECGKVINKAVTKVYRGYTRSCGCLRKEYYKKTYIVNWIKNQKCY